MKRKKFSGGRIQAPAAAGREVRMLPLCYTDYTTRRPVTWWHDLALEQLLEHQVVVHRLCHDLGDVGEAELDEGVATRRPGLLAPAQTQVGDAAKLKIKACFQSELHLLKTRSLRG